MTDQKKQEITRISKEFAKGFEPEILINESKWFIVDPLSVYLESCGFLNRTMEFPRTDKSPQVLAMVFPDGSQFIPAGADLKGRDEKFKDYENWMWV